MSQGTRLSSLIGLVFGVVPSQSKPIVTGCGAIILRVPAVEHGVAAFGPVAAVPLFALGGQQFGEIVVVLALVGGAISGIGGGVTLVGSVQDHVGRFHALREGGLPSHHGRLARVKIILAVVGRRLAFFVDGDHDKESSTRWEPAPGATATNSELRQ